MLCRNVLLTIKEAFRAGVNGDCPAHMRDLSSTLQTVFGSWFVVGICSENTLRAG